MYEELSKTEEGREWMEKANIKIDTYLAEKLEQEKDKEEEEEKDAKKKEDERADPVERGGEKEEDVPVPEDMDEEDTTLGGFLNKREWISEEHDRGIYEELKQRGKTSREAAAANAAEPGSTQKKARRERGASMTRSVMALLPVLRPVVIDRLCPGQARRAQSLKTWK